MRLLRFQQPSCRSRRFGRSTATETTPQPRTQIACALLQSGPANLSRQSRHALQVRLKMHNRALVVLVRQIGMIPLVKQEKHN